MDFMRRLFLFAMAVALSFAQPLPPLPPLPAPTILLVNGYQSLPCGSVTAEDTFGQLAQKLRDLGRTVEFFNNCAVPAVALSRPTIEEMGAALGQRIAAASSIQVDIVAHSMGGLILRSYLAGKGNETGVFRPPLNHKVRKAVFLGSPHFGPGFASILQVFGGLDPQVKEVLPGSQFHYDLATWNQGGDDLRGVDAVTVNGNSVQFLSTPNGGDGLVALSSASLTSFGFADERTRLVPYCHTDVGPLALVSSACQRPPFLAAVNSDEHLSWRVIRSFLNSTDEWKTIGTTLSKDPAGSTLGGVLAAVRDKDDNPLAGITKIAAAGGDDLQKGSEYYYGELYKAGRLTLTVNTPGGNLTTDQNIVAGAYGVTVIKPGARAVAVFPAAGRVSARALAPGMFVSIYGASLATSNAAATALPLPTSLAGTQATLGGKPLGLQFAGDTQINAILPEDAAGVMALEVKNSTGSQKLNLFIEPAIPAIFTQTGTGSGVASAIQAISGAVVTAASPAKPGDVISLYLTGLGATETRDGLQWALLKPTVLIGDMEAPLLYWGRAPGFAGLDQINFTVPATVPRGPGTSLTVRSGERTSNLTALPTV